MIDVDKFLDKSMKEYLLDGGEEFSFTFKHDKNIRRDYQNFENKLKGYPFLKITAYRDQKDGLIRVGRPSQITINVQDLKKQRPAILQVKNAWEKSISLCQFLDMKEFFYENYSQCLKHFKKLPSYVNILNYLLRHKEQVKGLYPRQIPHGLSSKILGKDALFLRLYRHYKERPLTWNDFFHDFGLKKRPLPFQFYADKIIFDDKEFSSIHSLITENNVSRFCFKTFSKVLIVENEESFFPLHGLLNNVLILLGSGKKAAGLGFLSPHLQGKIYYWGDLDKEGLEIFANIREIFPDAIPLLMDMCTLSKHNDLEQKIKKSFDSTRIKKIPLLGCEYDYLCRNGVLIEQEQIPLQEVLALLSDEHDFSQ